MFMSFWMIQRLTREINNLEKEVMDYTNQLSNYQKYASRLGGSSIMNINNLAGLSSDILPRASLFAQYSDMTSTMSAQQNVQAAMAMGRFPAVSDPMMLQQIQQSAFLQFKEQALKDLKEQEVAIMHEKENEIQLKINELEQRLKIKRKQLDSYEKLSDEEAQKWAPKFGL